MEILEQLPENTDNALDKPLLSWADIFETASPKEKMIASYMIKAVTVSRDYNLKVDFNISEAQYLNGMSMG